MNFLDASAYPEGMKWLFKLGMACDLPVLEGLIRVNNYNSIDRPPEEVVVMEKALLYGACFVFFEAGRHGRAPTPQAFIFTSSGNGDTEQQAFAELHKRLWSWGGVPLIYRAVPGCIQLFRCAHEPDFVDSNGRPICNPIRTLHLGAQIANDIWWDASRIQNGTVWDDPEASKLLLSSHKSAHRKLVDEIYALSNMLAARQLLNPKLRRRLLILSLLIAYLEERSVLLPEDFANARTGATRFFDVLQDGYALVSLLQVLENRFNGHVFSLDDDERQLLLTSEELGNYARLIDGYTDSNGQLNFWRLYSFRDLPIELISNIYQLFVTDTSSSIYTPPALVRLILEEVLSWERLDQLMMSENVILDPSCGSGVFLVEAYKRLVLHWRVRNGWQRPGIEELRLLLQRVHGIDIEEGAIELAAFSLCLSLCDALEPEDIRASIKLFPRLAGNTLHLNCFFKAKKQELITAQVAIIVGNPPFASQLSTSSATQNYHAYSKAYGKLADKQLAYLFLHNAMEMLMDGGILAMIEPAGFLYNQHAIAFRRNFFSRWKVREILDFVSVRGIFKKGHADPKIVVVIAEASKPEPEHQLLHAVFRRNGRAKAEQGFYIDYYDLHWLGNQLAMQSRDVWRANLFGGSRVHSFIKRLREFPTLGEFAEQRKGWSFGEGYFGGQKNSSEKVGHLVGMQLLPTNALDENGIDKTKIGIVPNAPIKDPKSEQRFTPPLLLIKEHENLYNDLWTDQYLVYKNEIVGFSAPKEDLHYLCAISTWLNQEITVLSAYVAGISSRLITQRATAIFSGDILSIPFLEDGNLDLSVNERIIAKDIVDYQRDFIRLGAESALMLPATSDHLESFDSIFIAQINAVYPRNPLRVLDFYHWSGAICKVYVFGEGDVDWSDADKLHDKLDILLREHRGTSLSITRIARVYDQSFLFLLKPDNHRFWTCSIALRDADDVLTDLRAQGF